jgi:hypothetical protein
MECLLFTFHRTVDPHHLQVRGGLSPLLTFLSSHLFLPELALLQALGVFLVWRSPSEDTTVALDMAVTLINRCA